MELSAKHVIVFRPRSPLAVILEDLCYTHLGNKNQQCLAVACSEIRLGMPGMLDLSIVPPGNKTAIQIQVALTEILLISDAPEPGQSQIGFLREG